MNELSLRTWAMIAAGVLVFVCGHIIKASVEILKPDPLPPASALEETRADASVAMKRPKQQRVMQEWAPHDPDLPVQHRVRNPDLEEPLAAQDRFAFPDAELTEELSRRQMQAFRKAAAEPSEDHLDASLSLEQIEELERRGLMVW